MMFDRTIKIIACLLGTLFLIGFASHCVTENNYKDKEIVTQNKIRANAVYKELASVIYEMGWSDWVMIENKNQYPSNQALMQKDADNAAVALTNYIKTTSNAGHLLSKPLWCKLVEFGVQNADILDKPGAVNVSKLMTSNEYWAKKHELLGMLWKEQANYNGEGDDPTMIKYVRSDCPEVAQK
jgi:hypothetical protein